jgi:hypothetical protein
MINDPDQRAEFEADVAAVAETLPALDPALRGRRSISMAVRCRAWAGTR